MLRAAVSSGDALARAFPRKRLVIKSPVPSSERPRERWHAAYTTAMTPPAMAVIASAKKSFPGPIQAPIAAQSFKSPIPMPRTRQNGPARSAATAIPARLLSTPEIPRPALTARPATRNGTTSQFGMRRLAISHAVAIARTINIAHQFQCMVQQPCPSGAMGSWPTTVDIFALTFRTLCGVA